MTTTLGLNTENDIYLGQDGNIVLLSDLEAIAGACETISKSQLGEMVLTTSQGIPNFQTVWVGVPNLGLWQSYLRNSLQNVDGVLQVVDLSFTTNNGILAYMATIKTAFGLTQITNSIQIGG
jgi:hypothetical protein